MEQTLKTFTELLSNRIIDNEVNFSEDTVRYTFFDALVATTNIGSNDISLEYSHTTNPNKKIDTYIAPSSERNGFVLEFKYDRNVGFHNSPKTLKAGKMMNDLYRLDTFQGQKNTKKWMIYLTDDEMASYFLNKNNKIFELFNLGIGNTLIIGKEMIEKRAATFKKALTDYKGQDIIIRGIHSKDFPKKHKLRIYEVGTI